MLALVEVYARFVIGLGDPPLWIEDREIEYLGFPDPSSVGSRNLEAALTALQQMGIPVDAEDTGGAHGRTVILEAGSGRMEVRALRVTVKVL